MKKIIRISILWLFLASLTGCANEHSFLEKMMLDAAGITEESSYKNYLEQLEAGNLDEEGYYISQSVDDANGRVHITFATNKNLDITYYTDAECTKLIDITSCYMEPGDSIYAKVSVSRDVYNSLYEFDRFNVSEYTKNGKRYVLDNWTNEFAETGMVCSIPADFEGSDLSIEPFGKYKVRELTLNAYYIDDANNAHSVSSGTWYVNDEVCESDSVEINAISSHLVSYKFDSEEYFFVDSVPQCFYSNNVDGEVSFNQADESSDTTEYSVELCKYIETSIYSGVDREVTVNGKNTQKIAAGEELIIEKLQYGQTVTIKTDRPWSTLEKKTDLILSKDVEESSDGQYIYTMCVPEKDGHFLFDPSEYEYEYGTIVFTCFGKEVTGVQCLAKKTRIYYKAGTCEDGYYLPAGERYIVVGDEEETRKQLENICFERTKQVTICLQQPEAGGSIQYYVNGSEITLDECEVYVGSLITMTFDTWEGWMCSAQDGYKYEVTTENTQIIEIDGKSVNEIFEEDNEHKPKLTVTLDKSVGEDLQFVISAKGLEEQTYSYKSEWYQGKCNVIAEQKIGTADPVSILMKNKAIPSGKAVKILVTKVDQNDKKQISEIRYVNDFTKTQEPIYIYDVDEIGTSTTWFKSVNIEISIVDVVEYEQPTAGKNTTLKVYMADTNQKLSVGDLIEESLKVKVKISAKDGYYLVDANRKNDTVYQDTMKYSKYLKKIEDLIEDHKAKKLCTVTLDTSDSYAKYVYKYDGKEVSGEVTLKSGEELTLEYEIVKDGYELKEGVGGIFGFGQSYKKVTETITITTDMDDTTITRKDFGIEVQEAK